MPADITKALRRRRMREGVAMRKRAVSVDQLIDMLREKWAAKAAEESEQDQRPRMH